MIYLSTTCYGCDVIERDYCPLCQNTRALWVSENDTVHVYPGGPMVGMWPDRYDALVGKLGVTVVDLSP